VVYMPDQFDKTIKSVSNEYSDLTRSDVQRASEVSGKTIRRQRSDGSGAEASARRQEYEPFSRLRPPDPEMWDTLIEAVRRFNAHQDLLDSPYAVRIWAQNDGIRVQLIDETSGKLVKQSKILPFSELTNADLNDIINDLIRERGIIIDFTR